MYPRWHIAKEGSINDFGLVIAYVLPGVMALWGTTYLSDSLRPWFGFAPTDAPTVGGFLYLTLASIAAGLSVSTVRWLVIDTIHHRTGISPPSWNFSLLGENVTAFGVLVEIHYRYYQWYANTVIALIWILLARRWSQPFTVIDLALVLAAVIFFLGSRDTLAKYYQRTGQLLSPSRRGGGQRRRTVSAATDRPSSKTSPKR